MQLNLEREVGRVFNGWSEGKISFAPTYKYSQNSDSYAGENVKSKKKRRTPAWFVRLDLSWILPSPMDKSYLSLNSMSHPYLFSFMKSSVFILFVRYNNDLVFI